MILFHRERGTGQPLLLLHAFPYDSRMWQPQFFYLACSYRMIAPDLPGFGRSPVNSNVTIESMAGSVLELLDALKIQIPVVLAGVSMGGYVAMALMRMQPLRFKSLFLCNTRCEADDDVAKLNRQKAIDTIRKDGAKTFGEMQVAKQLSPHSVQNLNFAVEQLKIIAGSQSAEGLIAGITALRERPEACTSLKLITIPTTVVVGESDTITPPPLAEKMQRLISGGKLVTIPHAGHLSHWENPAEFQKIFEIV